MSNGGLEKLKTLIVEVKKDDPPKQGAAEKQVSEGSKQSGGEEPDREAPKKGVDGKGVKPKTFQERFSEALKASLDDIVGPRGDTDIQRSGTKNSEGKEIVVQTKGFVRGDFIELDRAFRDLFAYVDFAQMRQDGDDDNYTTELKKRIDRVTAKATDAKKIFVELSELDEPEQPPNKDDRYYKVYWQHRSEWRDLLDNISRFNASDNLYDALRLRLSRIRARSQRLSQGLIGNVVPLLCAFIALITTILLYIASSRSLKFGFLENQAWFLLPVFAGLAAFYVRKQADHASASKTRQLLMMLILKRVFRKPDKDQDLVADTHSKLLLPSSAWRYEVSSGSEESKKEWIKGTPFENEDPSSWIAWQLLAQIERKLEFMPSADAENNTDSRSQIRQHSNRYEEEWEKRRTGIDNGFPLAAGLLCALAPLVLLSFGPSWTSLRGQQQVYAVGLDASGEQCLLEEGKLRWLGESIYIRRELKDRASSGNEVISSHDVVVDRRSVHSLQTERPWSLNRCSQRIYDVLQLEKRSYLLSFINDVKGDDAKKLYQEAGRFADLNQIRTNEPSIRAYLKDSVIEELRECLQESIGSVNDLEIYGFASDKSFAGWENFALAEGRRRYVIKILKDGLGSASEKFRLKAGNSGGVLLSEFRPADCVFDRPRPESCKFPTDGTLQFSGFDDMVLTRNRWGTAARPNGDAVEEAVVRAVVVRVADDCSGKFD